MDDFFMVLNQFLVMPLLFVLLHLAALVLSLAYWRRCPAACALLLPASVLNLIGTLGRIGLTFLAQGGDVPMVGSVMLGFTVLSWLGYGLMLMAIFAGRNEPTPEPTRSLRPLDDDDDEWGRPEPMPPSSTRDSSGIRAPR